MAHASGLSERSHRKSAAADRRRPLSRERVVGEDFVVEADVFKDGHDFVAAALKWRLSGKPAWMKRPWSSWRTIAGGASARFYENSHL